MDLRVTPQTLVEQAIASAQQQTSALDQLQQQASSGNRIIQPSDDPAGEVALLTAQQRNQQLTTDLANTQQAQTIVNAAASAIQKANDLITQANQLALQANNANVSSATLQTLATQADNLIGQLLATANTQEGGRYLFSGTASQTQPFEISAHNGQGQAETITYAGKLQQAEAIVGDQQSVATLQVGSQVFQQGGTADAFGALIHLRDVLENAAGTSASQQSQALSGVLTELGNAQAGLQNALGAIGTSAQTLGSQATQIQQAQLAVQQQISDVGGADLSKVLVDLQSQQNLLAMTLFSASKMMSVSLLNFLH